MTTGETPELAQLRNEIDQVGRAAARTVEFGAKAMIIAVAVFVLIVGEVLPWMAHANGLQVLIGQGGASGKPSIVPRLFATTSLLFGVGSSVLALMTRRWALAWVCALGGWFAAVDGLLAIWTRQAPTVQHIPGPGPGIGLIVSELAMIILAAVWLRTAASRR